MDFERLLSKATDGLSVGKAFGPPIEQAGAVVIPVAWVAGGGGGGGGEGAPETTSGHATGSGGGFGGVAWPLGVYVVKDGSVRWVPAVDATRILLAVLAIARLVVKIRSVRGARARS